MRVAFIGDIIGRPGREMLKEHLDSLKQEHSIDFAIANYENASHGFGLTKKNKDELLGYGVDVLSGGNHTWDKKEIFDFIDEPYILRPINYPLGVAGSGCRVYEVNSSKLAVVNILGHYAMPMVENPFLSAKRCVDELHSSGVKNIFIDFHAEATSEKRALMMLLQGRVSAISGTHTHVSSDDLHIAFGTAYISDIGLTGCRDNVIGMDKEAPLQQFLTGVKSHFDIPKKCKKILQMLIVDIEDGKAVAAKKIKLFDNLQTITTDAWVE